MRVQLFVPPGGYFAERWLKGSLMPSLGVLYLAAVLEESGHEVEVIPCHVLGLTWSQIFRRIEAARADIIGITTTTENRFDSFELAKIAKAASPRSFVVLGGPHCGATAVDTLSNIPEVDAVVSGEGEAAILEMARAISDKDSLNAVAGLSYRDDNNAVIQSPRRRMLADLDRLPFPARHLVPWERYNFMVDVPGKGLLPAANMMTSRGCPFACTFCATQVNWGREVRGTSPSKVIGEIEFLVEHFGSKVIWFYDDTFNYDPRRTNEICDLIIERKLNINWFCEIRVDLLSKALLAKMVESGLFKVGFGVESGSERVCRDIITKKQALKDVFNVVDWCHDFGVSTNPFFIFSHPTETWEEAEQTMEVLESLRDKADVGVSILHVYPGTELEERAIKEGVVPGDFSWTRKKDKHVTTLPIAQGNVPLYIDRLSWKQICVLIARYRAAKRGINLKKGLPELLKSIHSLHDLRRYTVLVVVYAKYRLAHLVRSRLTDLFHVHQ